MNVSMVESFLTYDLLDNENGLEGSHEEHGLVTLSSIGA
jgi:hypothetical protein